MTIVAASCTSKFRIWKKWKAAQQKTNTGLTSLGKDQTENQHIWLCGYSDIRKTVFYLKNLTTFEQDSVPKELTNKNKYIELTD